MGKRIELETVFRPNKRTVIVAVKPAPPMVVLSPTKLAIGPDPVLTSPPADEKDLAAIRGKLRSLLTKSEAKQLDAFFARLDKVNAQNRKNQKAWRERNKK